MKIMKATEGSIRRLRKAMYKLADENQEIVYLIAQPGENPISRYQSDCPYGVLESEANEWEKRHGEVIHPREV